MNLAQMIDCELVSEALRERSGLTLRQLQNLGGVNMRVHEARAPAALLEAMEQDASPAVTTNERPRRRAGRLLNPVRAEQVVEAIRLAGRRLSSNEIKRQVNMSDGCFANVVAKLIAAGTVTRVGAQRAYLFGLADMP